MNYIKTYIYKEHEIDFINMNLIESEGYVDKMIICEFDVHHNGTKREFIWDNIKGGIIDKFKDKIIYLRCEIFDICKDGLLSEINCHYNETLMRHHFTKLLEFEDEDIIFSLDSDEIIYNDKYEYIISNVNKSDKVQIKLNQFFYKMNYFWSDCNFIAPTISKYKSIKKSFNNWRYDGVVLKEICGSHFSWCMPIETMLDKINNYAHTSYKHLAGIDILEKAINDKKYPFDPKRSFTIEVLEIDDDRLPKSIKKI